jgi:hypothetical protein
MSLNIDALANQLLAMRAQLDAALHLIAEQKEAEGSVPEAESCVHPADQRQSLVTMGGPKGDAWRCRACGYEHRDELEATR